MKYVYLAKQESDNVYKIGCSKDPQKRVKQLQTGSSDKIELVSKFRSKYAHKVEKTLHRLHNTENVSGEWFRMDMNANDFLKECAKIDYNLGFIEENATRSFI